MPSVWPKQEPAQTSPATLHPQNMQQRCGAWLGLSRKVVVVEEGSPHLHAHRDPEYAQAPGSQPPASQQHGRAFVSLAGDEVVVRAEVPSLQTRTRGAQTFAAEARPASLLPLGALGPGAAVQAQHQPQALCSASAPPLPSSVQLAPAVVPASGLQQHPGASGSAPGSGTAETAAGSVPHVMQQARAAEPAVLPQASQQLQAPAVVLQSPATSVQALASTQQPSHGRADLVQPNFQQPSSHPLQLGGMQPAAVQQHAQPGYLSQAHGMLPSHPQPPAQACSCHTCAGAMQPASLQPYAQAGSYQLYAGTMQAPLMQYGAGMNPPQPQLSSYGARVSVFDAMSADAWLACGATRWLSQHS